METRWRTTARVPPSNSATVVQVPQQPAARKPARRLPRMSWDAETQATRVDGETQT